MDSPFQDSAASRPTNLVRESVGTPALLWKSVEHRRAERRARESVSPWNDGVSTPEGSPVEKCRASASRPASNSRPGETGSTSSRRACERAFRRRTVARVKSVSTSRAGDIGADQRWTMTTVPLPCSMFTECHPSGMPGSVKRKTRRASIGARLMHPWLRCMPK